MPHRLPLDEDVHLLATIPLQDASPRKNAEEFRFVAKRYRGTEVIDLRTFYKDKQGEAGAARRLPLDRHQLADHVGELYHGHYYLSRQQP